MFMNDAIQESLNEFIGAFEDEYWSEGVSINAVIKDAAIDPYKETILVSDVFKAVTVTRAWEWITEKENLGSHVDVEFVANVVGAMGLDRLTLLQNHGDAIKSFLDTIRKEDGTYNPIYLYVGLRFILSPTEDDPNEKYFGYWNETVAFLITLYECVEFNDCVFRSMRCQYVEDEDTVDYIISKMFEKVTSASEEIPEDLVKYIGEHCFYDMQGEPVDFEFNMKA